MGLVFLVLQGLLGLLYDTELVVVSVSSSVHRWIYLEMGESYEEENVLDDKSFYLYQLNRYAESPHAEIGVGIDRTGQSSPPSVQTVRAVHLPCWTKLNNAVLSEIKKH